jgi:tetratricopeptide (TPR) repeat protein
VNARRAGLVAFACVLNAHLGLAQQAEANAAGDRFREGREAMRRGDYATAREKLRESEQLDPSSGTLLNLAVCEDRLGHLLSAREAIQQFLTSSNPDDDRRPPAQRLADDLDARVPQLAFDLDPRDLAGLAVTIDGHPVATPQAPVALDPGSHQIEVSRPGYPKQRSRIELAERQLLREHFSFVRGTPAQQPTVVERPASKRRSSPLFYVALGTGIAGALAVVGSGLIVEADRTKVENHCDNKQCDNAGLAAARRGRAFTTVNSIAWSAALAGTSLAAYLWLSGKPAASKHYALSFSLLPNQASLGFEGPVP